MIPQPQGGKTLHGLCIHLPSFSVRMGSWCQSREVQWGQLCLPKSPSTTSVSSYLVFKFLLGHIFPLLESACLAPKRLEVPPQARAGQAESQCLI